MKQHLIIKTFLNFTLFLGSTLLLQAQNETIPLWINEIPGSKKSADYVAFNEKIQELEQKGMFIKNFRLALPALSRLVILIFSVLRLLS